MRFDYNHKDFLQNLSLFFIATSFLILIMMAGLSPLAMILFPFCGAMLANSQFAKNFATISITDHAVTKITNDKILNPYFTLLMCVYMGPWLVFIILILFIDGPHVRWTIDNNFYMLELIKTLNSKYNFLSLHLKIHLSKFAQGYFPFLFFSTAISSAVFYASLLINTRLLTLFWHRRFSKKSLGHHFLIILGSVLILLLFCKAYANIYSNAGMMPMGNNSVLIDPNKFFRSMIVFVCSGNFAVLLFPAVINSILYFCNPFKK